MPVTSRHDNSPGQPPRVPAPVAPSQSDHQHPATSPSIDVYRDGINTPDRRVKLSGHRMVIGRHHQAAVFLDDDTVSRPHAELVCGPFGRWWVHDLGSTNGTYVNGRQVAEQVLNPGDEIRIGTFLLRLARPHRQRLDSSIPLGPPSHSGWVSPQDDLAPMPATDPAAAQLNAAHLKTTLDLGRKLMAIDDAHQRVRAMCRLLVGQGFPATSATILRLSGPQDAKILYGPENRYGPTAASAPLSRSVLATLWTERESLLATNSGLNQLSRKLTIPCEILPMVVVACPLADAPDRLDVLYVELPPSHGNEEWRFLLALVADAFQQAELMAAMRQHARASALVENELRTARHIQDGLVPRAPNLAKLDVAVGYEPCHWVGGDYVDAIKMGDGRLLLAIADVCGKGMQAALVSSSLHTMVHTSLEASTGKAGGLAELVQRMNRYLCNFLPEHSFVTLTCMALDPDSGSLECINAGHPPPLLVTADGQVQLLQHERNVALGIMETEFEANHAILQPGAVLLLYTDGLTELIDEEGHAFGDDHFAEAFGKLVASHPGSPPATLKTALVSMLDSYRGTQLAADDMTFLVAQRSP